MINIRDFNTNEEYINLLKEEIEKFNFVSKEKFETNLKAIKEADVIGFDVDFTLSLYKHKNIDEIVYKFMAKYLIESKEYPKDIEYEKNSDFIHEFSVKDVIIDYGKGNVVKISEDKTIIKCYHGKNLLSENQIKEIYPNGKLNSLKLNCKIDSENCLLYICDNFVLSKTPLFLISVDLFDKGLTKNIKNYEEIIDNIEKSIVLNFGLLGSYQKLDEVGNYYPEISKHPENYLYDYNAILLFKKLREAGKRVFIATNSIYSYGKFMIETTMGKDYQNYCDLCFYQAGKPDFFNPSKTSPSKCVFEGGDILNDLDEVNYSRIINGENAFLGGSKDIIEKFYTKFLNKKEIKYLFVGDHIMTDCSAASAYPNWKSLFIFDDIKLDFIEEYFDSYGKKFIDKTNEKEKYLNSFALYFKNSKNIIMALPNVRGLNYLLNLK